MEITITPKRAKFSSAHSLHCFGEGHPCARKHGHTWWVQATFQGAPVGGLLIDYAVVSDTVRAFDHQDLDVAEVMQGLLATGENLLALLVTAFRAECEKQTSSVRVVRVELAEDPIPGDAHVLVWQAAC